LPAADALEVPAPLLAVDVLELPAPLLAADALELAVPLLAADVRALLARLAVPELGPLSPIPCGDNSPPDLWWPQLPLPHMSEWHH
jgi:hypothetical protein